ncbi:phytanoyl-CoA dioxygenase family protein [Paenibacillus sacheonensis]|uniref:Phytanoyl-CoA dioxygenase family protein n=1 Tax=Paenibacillus sacheonensis TaxID=742054 RepID=A0A7X4YNW8_9BACL|nr:phytanoyl-CoA dioxygenase family protein [Paenibacillus sacheonensis]MBM7567386.1 ectoine hydroxylase-related dioxygenase (phytanoyl-CoA dioxygenase family) [Paenibacillus sacheonensis]NBC69832.1 phytanoyl-CoA dioxygenase family protein [Paenibacillus sacheonensis]
MATSADYAKLPSLQDDYALSAEQIASYQRNGHILLREVATQEEINAYEPVIADVVREHNYMTKPVAERDTYGKAFIQIGNLWKLNEGAERFVLARRFAKIAAELMGVEGVRIYHDQALFKEPGGGHTPWHQDQIYWPLDTPNTITLWMPLVPVSEEVGSMTFVDGSQAFGYVSRQEISDESHKTLGSFIEGKQLPKTNYGTMAAGDATFHAGWTLHSAPGNPTDTMREVMTIIYIADGVRIVEPDSNSRRNDMHGWFPGLGPGDLAASPLNPLVYKA